MDHLVRLGTHYEAAAGRRVVAGEDRFKLRTLRQAL